ncbi:MAG: hypothetical protein IT372_42630 [Polyangiaceae bacterium]|nr:hypothetical protein [Polyangiaceae bacterium]
MGAFGESIDIFDPNFRALTDDQRILLQAAYMRLNTAAGTYWDDPDYGLLVSDLVNADMTEDEVLSLQSRVKAQLELDERLEAAIVTAALAATDGDNVSVKLAIRLVPRDGDAFTFTLAATELSVELLTGGGRA